MSSQAILDITVAPKSSRNKIAFDKAATIKVYLTDPPVDGKANSGLISLLSKTLKIPKSSISIVHGEASRKKRIAIAGMTENEVLSLLKKMQ